MPRITFLAFAGACVATVLAARASGGSLVAWVVDPHVKVFKDATPHAPRPGRDDWAETRPQERRANPVRA